jgi:hypothetical protein
MLDNGTDENTYVLLLPFGHVRLLGLSLDEVVE